MNDLKLLIAGKLVDGELQLEVINPATEEVISSVPRASEAQAVAAIEAARDAFPAWAHTDMEERRRCIRAIADALGAEREALARDLTREQGKPLEQALVEVDLLIGYFRGVSGIEHNSIVREDSDRRRVEVQRVPLGVVAAILPWNFPFSLMGFKLPFALLAGNSVVVKPAPTTPISALNFARIVKDLVPPGVINVIVDDGDLGQFLTTHPDIRKISFTGSTATGKQVMAAAADTLKRVTLEMGGNDQAIVLDDVDVAAAAPAIFGGVFYNAGQICIAIKRIYAQAGIYNALRDALADLAARAVVGDGSDPNTTIGPLQNRAQYEKVRSFIKRAMTQGAVVVGGSLPEGPGFFINPTIIEGLDDSAELVVEEQFGPVVPLLRFENEDEVIARSNATPYGLAASVWSSDEERALTVAQRLEAGTVWVNQHIDLDPAIPFAGAKQSGVGVECGIEGFHEFTQLRVINMAKRAAVA